MGKSGFEFNANQKADSRSIKFKTHKKKAKKKTSIKKSNKKQKNNSQPIKHTSTCYAKYTQIEKRKDYYSSIVSTTTTENLN